MVSGKPLFTLLVALALAGCNSSEAVLNVEQSKTAASAGAAAGAEATPAAAPGTDAAAAANSATPTTATPSTTAPATPAVKGQKKLLFAPIVGAPVTAATPLSRRLSAQAKSQNIALNTSADTDTTHVMKGYFSALSEGNQTTVIYVWDVLDPAGNRLHRIQGQQKVAGSASDPWTIVPATVMEAIADATMKDYSSWAATSQK